jgi:LPS-assembly protein
MSASLGQVFYFEDRLVSITNAPGVLDNDSSSAIAAEMQLQPDERIALTGSTLWDPEDERIDEGGMALKWRPDTETIVNVGYRYRRDQALVDPSGIVSIEDIDQVDFSTAFPLGQNWRLLARYQYDLTNDTSLEETAGLEYSSCCWALRMVYQEGVDWEQGRDYGVYVEFVLRGLGSLGKNIDQLLQKSIFGYGEFDRYYGASR